MGGKQYFDFIVCVVVYRNYLDLEELLNSIRMNIKEDCHVIIVNNFCDEESEKIIENIAINNGCDFIHSENNGYGAGNNIAIDFALHHYEFRYCIISNPDIIINTLSLEAIDNQQGIIAPCITTKTGKMQNPMVVYDIPLATALVYKGLKNDSKVAFFTGLLINKMTRDLWRLQRKEKRKKFSRIYMAHGSFVIIDRESLQRLHPIYDEKMFLFAEEGLLAIKARQLGVSIWYTDLIRIFHKEDGSMKFRNDINLQLKQSNIYVYEKYYKEE